MAPNIGLLLRKFRPSSQVIRIEEATMKLLKLYLAPSTLQIGAKHVMQSNGSCLQVTIEQEGKLGQTETEQFSLSRTHSSSGTPETLNRSKWDIYILGK